MVSELDLEFLRTMADIERMEKAQGSGEGHPSSPPSGSSRVGVGRVLLFAVILALLASILYLAYLAGVFGTIRGQRGLWRAAYGNRSDQYADLEALYANQSQQLKEAQEEADAWRSQAGTCLRELEESRSEMESRISEIELVLDETLLEKERIEDDLGRDRDEWRDRYLLTRDELSSLEDRYSDLDGELDRLRNELTQALCNRSMIEVQLQGKIAQMAELQAGLVLLQMDLGNASRERDEWVERFHELELSYRDLLCELRISETNEARWKELFEEQIHEINDLVIELDECRSEYDRLLAALEEARGESNRLARLHRTTLARLESILSERDRWRQAYEELNLSHWTLAEEVVDWESRCQNLTTLLIQMTSERDHWVLLYGQLSSQLSHCSDQAESWRRIYQSAQFQLQNALAEIDALLDELALCQSETEHWKGLYESTQAELEKALDDVEHWKGLYMNLANIAVDLCMGNITVEERMGGSPSVISVDITACVSSVDTPVHLLLEYWAEPLDCIYGYGSLLEEVSSWPGDCKTFHVTLDFGEGLGPHRIIARATLRPINGEDQTEETGPS